MSKGHGTLLDDPLAQDLEGVLGCLGGMVGTASGILRSDDSSAPQHSDELAADISALEAHRWGACSFALFATCGGAVMRSWVRSCDSGWCVCYLQRLTLYTIACRARLHKHCLERWEALHQGVMDEHASTPALVSLL